MLKTKLNFNVSSESQIRPLELPTPLQFNTGLVQLESVMGTVPHREINESSGNVPWTKNPPRHEVISSIILSMPVCVEILEQK